MATHEIGGFFGLELARGTSLHAGALALNSGRNALRLLLRASGLSRIHLPLFCCPDLVTSIQAEGVAVAFYPVTDTLEPEHLEQPPADEAVLLVNYFGLGDATVRRYAKQFDNVIVDQCQALFAPPQPALGSIYSPRKFVGVADGGYLITGLETPTELPVDASSQRYRHCLQRLDTGAPSAFAAYQREEAALSTQPPAWMSRLTRAILDSIDYDAVSRARRENFARLHAGLSRFNRLSPRLDEQAVPMIYPLVIDAPGLREHLVEQGIYVARYWPDSEGVLPVDPVSERLSRHLLPLPIDQRYGASEMQLITETITAYLAAQHGSRRRQG